MRKFFVVRFWVRDTSIFFTPRRQKIQKGIVCQRQCPVQFPWTRVNALLTLEDPCKEDPSLLDRYSYTVPGPFTQTVKFIVPIWHRSMMGPTVIRYLHRMRWKCRLSARQVKVFINPSAANPVSDCSTLTFCLVDSFMMMPPCFWLPRLLAHRRICGWRKWRATTAWTICFTRTVYFFIISSRTPAGVTISNHIQYGALSSSEAGVKGGMKCW